MARSILAAAAILALPACVSAGNPGDTCRAAPGQAFIGRAASSAVGAELLRVTSSRILRWVPPGTIVTTDYKFGRLTVAYDGAMTITTISCG